MKKAWFALSYLAFAFCLNASAQDVHFSQFYAYTPLINPSLTGYFDGDYRISAIHRNQWKSVTKPFTSYGGAVDAHNFLGQRNWGAGLAFFQDEAGDSHLKTTQVSMGQSFYLQLNQYRQQYVGLGVQADYTQRTIDFSELSFDNQFNGYYYDPGRSTGENFLLNQRSYLGLNAGMSYISQFGERNSLVCGISMYNLNRPKQTFFRDEDVILDKRFNAHLVVNHMVNASIDLVPSLLYTQQGHFKEILYGLSTKFLLHAHTYGDQMFVLGVWHRFRDALIVGARMDHPKWKVGLSYDFNLSTLRAASTGLGGVELSAVYIFKRTRAKSNYKKTDCPIFI